MKHSTSPWLLKKYGNRRLYDTEASRYITLDEVAKEIHAGAEVHVTDAKSGRDLTQATLAQIILDGRSAARLLPVPLLIQLIRMEDDALVEFFSRYVMAALAWYLQAKEQARAATTLTPFGAMPSATNDALARLFGASPWPFGGLGGSYPYSTPAEAARPRGAEAGTAQVEELRREVEELKKDLHRQGKLRRGRRKRR